jgi:hypothetical protein
LRTTLQILALLLLAAALALPLSMPGTVEGQGATEAPTTDMDAKTDDLFNNFGARGTPINECVAEPQPPTARGNGRLKTTNLFLVNVKQSMKV